MRKLPFSVIIAVALACAPASATRSSGPATAPIARTTTAITAADLRHRLFLIAHDSMMGRAPGDVSNFRTTAYIAAEFARVGLKPAGEDGTWFQALPFYRRAVDKNEVLRVDAQVGRTANRYDALLGIDYAPQSGNARFRPVDGVAVVYAGLASDSTTWITATAAQNKALLFSVVPPERRTAANRRTNMQSLQNSARFRTARTLFVAELDAAGASTVAAYISGSLVLDTTWRDVPPLVIVSNAFAEKLLGRTMTGIRAGVAGNVLRGSTRVGVFPLEFAARNVVGILEGTDATMNKSYVSVTAHNDHVGYDNAPVDHDSLRVFNTVVRPMGADSPNRAPTAPEQVRIRTLLDSLRRMRPARLDSIRNGADDDGSGTVGILEIAELMASGARPRRSILFVSHTAEEAGLLGSQWYTDHPTVNRDSIIAEIDIDMIGRGGKLDLPEGGPTYLEVVGYKRLSTEFGAVLEASNKRQQQPFVFNLAYDVAGHPLQYYCRADHYSYARYGIPSVSFSRGGHQDYHQITDEPQYIDYDALARVATLVKDAAWDVAMRDARPKLDKAKTDPKAPCRQ